MSMVPGMAHSLKIGVDLKTVECLNVICNTVSVQQKVVFLSGICIVAVINIPIYKMRPSDFS